MAAFEIDGPMTAWFEDGEKLNEYVTIEIGTSDRSLEDAMRLMSRVVGMVREKADTIVWRRRPYIDYQSIFDDKDRPMPTNEDFEAGRAEWFVRCRLFPYPAMDWQSVFEKFGAVVFNHSGNALVDFDDGHADRTSRYLDFQSISSR